MEFPFMRSFWLLIFSGAAKELSNCPVANPIANKLAAGSGVLLTSWNGQKAGVLGSQISSFRCGRAGVKRILITA
jgi:hypothetical protein